MSDLRYLSKFNLSAGLNPDVMAKATFCLIFNDSAPPFIIEQIIKPALANGRIPVILAEEWHTAEALIRLYDQLEAAGIQQRCALFWNANNTMSFHRVNWTRLNQAAQITTVSRYMKHLMWDIHRFVKQMQHAAEQFELLFGKRQPGRIPGF